MKRAINKLAVILITMSLFVTIACNTAGASRITSFSDVSKDHWGYETIMDMTERGLFKGTTEPVNGVGTFSPDKVMTRAEFVTVAMRATFPNEAQSIGTKGTQWWSGFYSLAMEKGILRASELNNGDLSLPMSREEMAMVMVRCVENNGESLTERVSISQIADYYSINDYYKNYVRDCFSFGLLCGVDSIGTFAPAKSLTRAEGATVLSRLLDKDARVEVTFGDDSIKLENEDVSETEDDPEAGAETMPWEETGAKQPEEYTWEEYCALSIEQQIEFQNSFSDNGFEAWLAKIQEDIDIEDDLDIPDVSDSANDPASDGSFDWVQTGTKKPEDYTWEEFCALTNEQQDAFINSFDSQAEFEAWLNKNKGNVDVTDPGLPLDKKPEDYTWEEFCALDEAEMDAFIASFDSQAAFEAWLLKFQD